MISILNQLEADNGDNTKRYSEELYDTFNHCADTLACYMNHDDVDEVEESIVFLRSAVHHHSDEEIRSAIEMVRAQLERLRNIDSIRIKNVL